MNKKNPSKNALKIASIGGAVCFSAFALIGCFTPVSRTALADYSSFPPIVGEYPQEANLYCNFFSLFNLEVFNGKNFDYGAPFGEDSYVNAIMPMPYTGREGSSDFSYSWSHGGVSYGSISQSYANDGKTLNLRTTIMDREGSDGSYVRTSLSLKYPMYVDENLFGMFAHVSNTPLRVKVTTNGSNMSGYPTAISTVRCNIAFLYPDGEELKEKTFYLSPVTLPSNGSYYNLSGYLPSWSNVSSYASDGYLYLTSYYIEVTTHNLTPESGNLLIPPIFTDFTMTTPFTTGFAMPYSELFDVQNLGAQSFGLHIVNYVEDLGANAIWNWCVALLDTEIFPNFRLSYLLYIAIALTIFGFFIKYALGG